MRRCGKAIYGAAKAHTRRIDSYRTARLLIMMVTLEVPSSPPIYQEIIDLLTSGPTADQQLAIKISDAAQERLEELLRKNREEELTAEERTDLNTYLHSSEYLTRLKA